MSGRIFTRVTKPASTTPARRPNDPVHKRTPVREPLNPHAAQPQYSPSMHGGAAFDFTKIPLFPPAQVQAKPTLNELEEGPQERRDNDTASATFAPPDTGPPPPRRGANLPGLPILQRQGETEREQDEEAATEEAPIQTRPLAEQPHPDPRSRADFNFSMIPLFPPNRAGIQAKLRVGEHNDKFEQEADRVADTVMRMPKPGLQQRGATVREEEEEPLQTKPIAESVTPWVQRQAETEGEEEEVVQAKARQSRTSTVPAELEGQLNRMQGRGQSLSAGTRRFFESRFDQNFGQVRIHADGQAADAARQLHAQAFTQSRDVYFGSGRYQPDTRQGRHLLAHELTHVVQQRAIPNTIRRQASPELADRSIASSDVASDGVFAIRSSAGSTVKRGHLVTYSVALLQPTLISAESAYRYHWSVENDPKTYPIYVRATPNLKKAIEGPENRTEWALRAVVPGTHLIKLTVMLNDSPVSNLVFAQTVTDDGRSLIHKEIIEMAEQAQVDKDVKEWTTWDIIKWKFPILGDPDYIFDFKKQWVHAYRDVIKAAARKFDLPELLVGAIAYSEVGGDPLWIDGIAHSVREFDHAADPLLEPLTITKQPELTSFGNVSIQIRRAAEVLGYEPEKLSEEQEDLIIESLKEPKQNIFIAAKFLAELRDIDFKGKSAEEMTLEDIMVVAVRWSRRLELSLEDIKSIIASGEGKIVTQIWLYENLEKILELE